MSTVTGPVQPGRIEELYHGVYRDGVVALAAAPGPDWADGVAEDFAVLFEEARARAGGTAERGPGRWYFPVHPERLRGFVELVTAPELAALAERALGPDYLVVELGFEVPLPGAARQPWHRDFPTPPETQAQRWLTSLTFAVATVDVTPAMGSFEVAPGSQWDDGGAFDHGVLPPASAHAGYEALAEQHLPRRGDVAACTGLMVHRGGPNRSRSLAPVLAMRVVHPSAAHGAPEIMVTPGFYEGLPREVLSHLSAAVVDELGPLVAD